MTGLYAAAVTFNNLSIEQDPVVRDVNLDVQYIRGIWTSPESFDVTLVEGMQQQDTLTVGNDGTETVNFTLRSRSVSNADLATASAKVIAVPQKRIFNVQQAIQYEHKPGQVLVRFRENDGAQLSASSTSSRGLSDRGLSDVLPDAVIVREYDSVSGLSLVQLPADMTVQEALESLNAMDHVLYAQPNYRVYANSVFPNDTRFDDLWGLHNTGQTGGVSDADIDVPEAWDISQGSDSVVVAVIDTGIDYDHEDLAANMWVNTAEYNGSAGVDDDGNGYVDDIYGYDFDHGDGDPMDDHYHGTHCAGTIGAVGNNGIGIAGVCWNVKIMAVKFLDSSGGGWTSDAIDSVEYATLMGADIMSNSWGGGSYDQSLKDAIDAAGAAGIIFVAAAGNDSVNNDTYPHYPSSYTSDNVIAVMSTDDEDRRSSFSCWGPTSVDIAAPGTSILSCEPGNRYQYLSGTSMATPHVAGACALLRSISPGLSVADTKDILFNSVDLVSAMSGLCVSEGRLNLNNAVLETTVPWIEFDIEQGTLGPDETLDVTVTFNAGQLSPGNYHAEILVLSDDPARPQLTIPVSLTVVADPLEVTPEAVFDPNGLEGGPFEPNSMIYTLTNTGVDALDWSADWQADWLTIDPVAGTLAPSESIDVTVSLNANAQTLVPKLYEDSIFFNNLTIGSARERLARLIVRPPDKFTEVFDDSAAVLENASITFRPDDSVSYYAACVGKESVGAFTSASGNATFVAIGDDDYVEVVFTDSKQMSFYGVLYDRVFIGSNGYLTFGQGDTEFDPWLEYHFGLPRISALFTDLTPADNQSVSYIQTDDRIAVTYENIPVFGDKDATNSFQIELFFADGSIRISYLNIAASGVIAGLSDGQGLPGFFEESDLLSYLNCCDCGDTNGDGAVLLDDLCEFALAWLNAECIDPDWCGRNDFDRSGQVDLLDWTMMAENWQNVEHAWSEPEFLLELNGKAWSQPQYYSELDDDHGNKAKTPCLSRDGLEMYFQRYVPSLGRDCVIHSQRDRLDAPFLTERVLLELVSGLPESWNVGSPWISDDGKRLYYHEDIAVGSAEIVLKMAEWSEATQQWIPAVRAFDELHLTGSREALASLTADERIIFWQAERSDSTGSWDIWTASRSSIDQPFGNIRELTEIIARWLDTVF
ncbi:MAG: S8 family serine peptidase [Planctomycetota bacterium]|jgi:subtilisin family serine protease